MKPFWIALNSIKGLGPVKIQTLIRKFGNVQAAFEQCSNEMLRQTAGMVPEKTQLLDLAHRQIEQAQAKNIHILTPDDAEYPANLREIYAPPPVLYVQGNCSIFAADAIAVVGTRRCTTYGKNVTSKLVKELVDEHIAIISGLAHGIDTVAHKTCLDCRGKTVAVLGCGLDICYPSDNKALLQRIIESGAAVSEFPLGTAPESYNFPRRNRIISGLSAGVLVIEAPEKSGSLITANYALQQGRDVFAVPGPIVSPASDGPFTLLKNGAIPVKSAVDIIDSMQFIARPVSVNNLGASATTAMPQHIPDGFLSAQERILFDVCSGIPQRVDTLSELSGKPVSELFDILLSLELKGLLQQVAGQQYIRVTSL